VAAVALTIGCADTSWEAAHGANTVASYHRFLRDNPESPKTVRAHEEIAYLRLANNPTLQAHSEFEANWPESEHRAELHTLMEDLYFERARRDNTAEAYHAFLTRYPEGAQTQRARGNLRYVSSLGPNPSADALRAFIEQHPESDFVPDAESTLQLLQLRHATAIEHLWVRVDVAANVESPNRVRRGFASVVAEAYRKLGVQVSMLDPGAEPPTGTEAWMLIDYQEAPAQGTFGGRTLIAQCRVRLFHRDAERPVWDRKFEAPAEHRSEKSQKQDRTIFGNARYRFWESFFVPVSTWATSLARVAHRDYAQRVVGIDVRGDRAAVLFKSGSVEYLDVSSPLDPKVLGQYRRQPDLSEWLGVRVLPDDRVVIYGHDGIEVVKMARVRATKLVERESSDVGSIRDAALYDDGTLLMVGNKGAWAIRLETPELQPHRLIQRDYVGIAVRGPYVYLLGRDHLDWGTAKQVARKLTGGQLRLGSLEAEKVRLMNDSLYVFGRKAIVEFSLQQPQKPVPVAKIDPENLGRVSDLVADGSHIYLVGDRGLQVADHSGEWIADRIQVQADRSAAARGRFLYLAGGSDLEILDMSPYREAAAAPER
jgi:hypothetical protein